MHMSDTPPPTGTPPPPGPRRRTGEATFGVIRPGGSGVPSRAPGPPSTPEPGAGGGDHGVPPDGTGPIVPHVSSGRSTAGFPGGPPGGAPPPPGSFGAGVAGPGGPIAGHDPLQPAAPATGGGLNANAIVSGLVAGGIGGFAGFVLSRLYEPGILGSPSEVRVQMGFWTSLVGVGIAVVLAAWSSASSGAWEQAWRRAGFGVAVGAIAGFLAGYAAQALYASMLDGITIDDLLDDSGQVESKMLQARVIGWGLLGTILGAGTGLPLGAKKVVNGLVGGAIGGAVGGFVFQKVGESATSSTGPQLVGILCTGLAIGLFVGIVDRITRQHWLQGVAGPLRGREIILFKPRTTVGSAPTCDLVLANDPTVAPHHLTLVMAGSGLHLEAAAPVRVDGAAAPPMTPLRAGQTIEAGRSAFTVGQRTAPRPGPTAGSAAPFGGPPPPGRPGSGGPGGPWGRAFSAG